MKKIALVTGASGNLGKAVIKKLISGDFQVTGIVSPRTSSDFVSSASFEIFQANLADESVIREILQRIFDKYPVIDSAVLTAGGFASGNIRNTGKQELDKMFRINFETAYFTAREVFRKMEEQPGGGRIIFIGSRPSIDPASAKSSLAYSLSKSLLLGLSGIINEEGKKKNIFSSVVIPGIIDTPENRESMPDADFANWVSPELIADNIAYLLSESGRVLRQPIVKVYGNS